MEFFSWGSVVTCPLDHGEGPQAWPGWGFILNTAGSSSWAYNLNSIAHSAPPVTINSFITSSCPLTPFNSFTGIILGTENSESSLPCIHSDIIQRFTFSASMNNLWIYVGHRMRFIMDPFLGRVSFTLFSSQFTSSIQSGASICLIHSIYLNQILRFSLINVVWNLRSGWMLG